MLITNEFMFRDTFSMNEKGYFISQSAKLIKTAFYCQSLYSRLEGTFEVEHIYHSLTELYLQVRLKVNDYKNKKDNYFL